MEINFKYKIDQKVYFLYKNQICSGNVYTYKATIDSDWRMQTHNYNPSNSRLNVRIKYKVSYPSYSNVSSKWIPEGDLYETKEELLNFIPIFK